jgi:hypothetical protein
MRGKVKMGFERRKPGRPPLGYRPQDREHAAWCQAHRERNRRYRLMIFDQPAGPWRSGLDEAQRDAVRGGHGSRCEQTGQMFMTVPAWIWEAKIEPS